MSENKMKCENCGNVHKEDVQYCEACGTEFLSSVLKRLRVPDEYQPYEGVTRTISPFKRPRTKAKRV